MDHLQYSQTRKHQTKHKKRLSQDQVNLLETNFIFTTKLDPESKSRLAMELGVPPRQIAVWFQNRRARDKTQSLELDHQALQLRLENVLADNARLKEEAKRLKAELRRIHGELNSFNSVSSCESGLIQKQNLERELYGSLIGGGGGQFMALDGYNFFGSS